MDILDNMLLQSVEGNLMRVTWCDRVSSHIYVIDLEGKRWPYLMMKEAVYGELKTPGIDIMQDDVLIHVDEDSLSKAQIARRDKAMEVVLHVLEQVDNSQQIFISKYRIKAIKRTATIMQISISTVKNYLIEYWVGGKVPNSLLPSFNKCGARGKEKAIGERKRGRPRKYGNQTGINIDENIKRIFKTSLGRYYYSQKQNSLKTTYDLMMKDFFTIEKVKKDGGKTHILKSNQPTYHQFYYWFKLFNNRKHEISKRHGTRIYFQKHRAIIGNSTDDSGLLVSNLWQTDSTPLNITLVSSINRNIIVGKPLLHLVVDAYSRVIVGFNLSFESLNAYSGAMTALLNSMTNKKEFCSKFGVEIDDNEWDVACIPSKIFTDRGELNGKQIESAIDGLGISIQNSPSYRPELKGTVEQALNQIQIQLAPHVDGASISGKRVRERGESDLRLKANLTIEELTAIIIKLIIFHNNYHVMQDYELTEEMLEQDIEKIPMKIWNFCLRNQKGQLRTLPTEYIRMHLLQSDKATITSRGVKFKKLLYTSELSLQRNWFESARHNGSKRLNIKFDARDLTEIYTINEDGSLHTLKLLNHLSKYKSKSIAEVEQINNYEKEMEVKSKQKELEKKMQLLSDIDEITSRGKLKTETVKDDTISKTRKLRGIKNNQKREREIQREIFKNEKQSEGLYTSSKNMESVTNYINKDNVEELTLFRQLRDE
ncbi:Mu transposase C-terminal domain-containing protein [Sporosarcina sp. BI001-red]|uniref:Mu transposase C-terminal domain-containing protein n=1 Tax=Sporosarcina sp. BI001-red TaxID=2282866 RepID=UPI001314AA67|nr:Mu transposase C-terminal domain-containing protein [Sporosarcina sp. BI001-red]